MRVGIFSFIMTASLLTGGSLGAQVAQASMGQLKPADVVLIDSRGCERPEASPFDPFNKNLLRPCAAWVTYSQVELKDLGLFTVSKTRTQGGLKPRAAQVSGSTPENYAIAKNISVLRSLLQNFKNSREQTEIFVSTLEQLNHWMRMARLADEFLDAKGNALFKEAGEVLMQASQAKSRILAYEMPDELRGRIHFALSQIRPRESELKDLVIAHNEISTFAGHTSKQTLVAPHGVFGITADRSAGLGAALSGGAAH